VKTFKGTGTDRVDTGKVIGDIYHTDRKPQHFFRMYHGFAFSVELINPLKEKGVKFIIIRYLGMKGIIFYKSRIEDWKRIWNNKLENGMVDQQFVLDINDMEDVTPQK